MAFLKHIGKHGDRKVVVVFRQIPGDDHMCLVIYPDLLPTHMHDSIMKLLESPIGQAAEDFADALHRNLFPDGRNMLETIHHERMMKRVNTEQVLITPNTTSHVKLSELNTLLNEMKLGEGAVKRLAEIDANAGLVDAQTKRTAEQQYKSRQSDLIKSQTPTPMAASPGNSALALSDQDIATNLLVQAERMITEGNSLIKEAARLKKEAEQLHPRVTMKSQSSRPAVVAEEPAPVPKRGRPAKVKTANAS
jgi:hypothetical protein